MAVEVARLQAVLSAKTDDFDRGMDHSERRMHLIGGLAGKAFKAVGVAAIAGGTSAAAGIGYAIKASSDLGEQINKSNVVFGKNAIRVTGWSKHLTRDFGLSARAALE